MADDLIPLGGSIAIDIRDTKQSGIVLPVRSHDETMLLTDWDGEMHGMMLTGDHSFIYFPVSLKNPHTGLFIPEPEILIDTSSAVNGLGREHDEGVLILSKDHLSVVGRRAGDQFGDPALVPIWKAIHGGSQAAKVAFTSWGIGIPNGAGYRTLWKRLEPVTKSTKPLYENV